MLRVCLLSAALAALLSTLAGCGAAPGDAASPQPAGSPQPAAPSAAPAATAGGASGLAGLVVAASDVAGEPDTPLAGQLVAAVPLARADAVLGLGGREPTAELLRFLKAPLPAGDPAVLTALSDGRGQYALGLGPGPYVLCLADGAGQPPALPATTRGCGLVEVPAGQVRAVDLSSGFGEVLLVVR